jgi:hypothetical protein
VILHADKAGVFDYIEISKELPAIIVEEDLWVEKGDRINAFEGANDAIGTLVLRFDNKGEMDKAIKNVSDWLKVIVR